MSVASRTLRALSVGLFALALGACAGRGGFPARPAPEDLPEGSPLASRTLEEGDAWLRHYLMNGAADSALAMLSEYARTAPRDALVRRLQEGLVLHYAGRYAESNAAFEWAEAEAERRWTQSVTQQVGALLVNDAVVAYTPPPPELAMIPYYRMLNYMALGSTDGTLVEARKTGALATRLSEAEAACAGEGLLQYFAGLVFRGAGERSDALVSYRRAEQAFSACAGRDEAALPNGFGADLYRAALEAGVRDVADSAAARYQVDASVDAAADAELVVFVEHGFVAHRAHADIHVPIWPSDVEGVGASAANGINPEGSPGVAGAATRIAARLAGNLLEQAEWGSAADERLEYQLADAVDGAYIMKLAWPVYRLEAAAPARVRLVVDSVAVDAPVAGDLSAAVYRRWQAQRAGMITRVVGRGIAKYLVTRGVEKEAEKEDPDLGWLAGRITNLVGNHLERADTRSWSLLPDRISVARLTLPPGEHQVKIEVVGADGEAVETVDLGTVELAPRGTLVLNRRVWGTEMGDLRHRVARAPEAKAAVAP